MTRKRLGFEIGSSRLRLVGRNDEKELMEIKYLGHSSFLINTKTATIVIDPFDEKATGFSFPKVSADIVLSTHSHPDHSNISGVSGNPFIIAGPGEYEVKDVKVDGIPTFHDSQQGKERGKNTVYLIRAEGMSLLHCGDLGHTFSDKQLEYIGAVDILMVPVGGTYTIEPEEAGNLVAQIEPKIVIPMHYKTAKHGKSAEVLLPLDNFLKEIGGTVREEKTLKIKRENLPPEMEVVILG